MQDTIEIENIEEMRRVEGIDDVELRMEIRTLKAGDFVNLTFMTSKKSCELLIVRITSIRGSAFRGKLVDGPTATRLKTLGPGTPVVFTTAHIHSLLKRSEAPR